MYGDNYSINLDINKHFARYEDPLYDDEEYENEKKSIYQIKKRKDGDSIVIDAIKNGKVIYSLDCSKLSKKNQSFVLSTDGMLFILDKLKEGIKSLNGIKKELKQR